MTWYDGVFVPFTHSSFSGSEDLAFMSFRHMHMIFYVWMTWYDGVFVAFTHSSFCGSEDLAFMSFRHMHLIFMYEWHGMTVYLFHSLTHHSVGLTTLLSCHLVTCIWFLCINDLVWWCIRCIHSLIILWVWGPCFHVISLHAYDFLCINDMVWWCICCIHQSFLDAYTSFFSRIFSFCFAGNHHNTCLIDSMTCSNV